MTTLETQFDTVLESMDRDHLIKLVQLLRRERNCAQSNLNVTHKAYVMLDRQLRETLTLLNGAIDNLPKYDGPVQPKPV